MTKCENNARDPVRARQKLDSALVPQKDYGGAARGGRGSCRGEKELSRRAAAPRGINESNKFRGLLKLKFDLRPTGDYRRAKLPLSRRLERADKWIAPNSDALDRRLIPGVLSREKSRKRHHHSQRIQLAKYACKFLSDVFGCALSETDAARRREERSRDKLKCLKLESNQARKRRHLATNEERRAALFTRNWLNLLGNKLCIRENYGNQWSNYVVITVFLAEHWNKGDIKKVHTMNYTGRLESRVYLRSYKWYLRK